jgi:hypothetical protein
MRLHYHIDQVPEVTRKGRFWEIGWRSASRLREERLSHGLRCDLSDSPETPRTLIPISSREPLRRHFSSLPQGFTFPHAWNGGPRKVVSSNILSPEPV